MSSHPPAAPSTTPSYERPADSRVLRSILRDLRVSVEPEIVSRPAKAALQMTTDLLCYLIARQEDDTSHLREHANSLAVGVRALDELTAVGGEDETGLPSATLACSSLTVQDPRDTERWHATVALDLEDRLCNAVPRLVEAPSELARKLRRAIGIALQSERALLDRMDAREAAVLQPAMTDVSEPRLTATMLTEYLMSRLPAGAELTVLELVELYGGYSKQTFIAKLAGRDRPAECVVLRRDVAGGPIESSAIDEAPLLRTLYPTGVPVAEPLWAQEGPNMLGRQAFMITKAVTGKPILNSRQEFESDQGAVAGRVLARVLARLHCLDVRDLRLMPAGARDARSMVRQHIAQMEDQWKRRRLWPSPSMAAAFAWMQANVPEGAAAPRLVHGDASLRNLLIDQGKATALLDWELWHLGDPNEDLAYCRADVERVMPWNEFIREYTGHGGREYRPETAQFYEMWANLRNAVLSGSGGHGFETSAQPDSRFVHAGVRYHRGYVCRTSDLVRHVLGCQ